MQVKDREKRQRGGGKWQKHVGKEDEDTIECPRDARMKDLRNTDALRQLHKVPELRQPSTSLYSGEELH